jgi:hypothetical protein
MLNSTRSTVLCAERGGNRCQPRNAALHLIVRALVAGFVVWTASTLRAAPPTESPDPGKRPLILVHYMPWYSAKLASPQWGWHWTMNVFDPEKQEQGRRSIASHYYPLIGPYDSGDPVVLEYHLLLMKLAGIDGVIADWYGLSNHFSYPVEHRNTGALFQAADRLRLKYAVCYEDHTIGKLVEAGKLAAAERVKHARAEVDWLRKNWFARPAYLRIANRPLFLSFGFDGLTDPEWEVVFADEADKPVYLSEHRRRSIAAGAFDWPVPKDFPASLDRYYRALAEWPVSMPVAFPRFHDIYAEANVHASWGNIPDDDGRTWAITLQRALKSGAPFVQIATWNDWGEGTGIEPTEEFGYRDLEVVQRLRREIVDAQFDCNPEDLRLAHRLIQLRRDAKAQPERTAALDKIAQMLATGALSEARAALELLKAGRR